MFCICFFHIIQCSSREGEEDGELYQGALELTDDFGKGCHWQGELTGAGDFGEERVDIRVFWRR